MIYTHAIVREPGENFSQGLTTAGMGPPDHRTALEQHRVYVDTLLGTGLEVTVIEPDPDYPDGCFVEDMAVVTPEVVVITNSGAESRRGERDVIAASLRRYRELSFIERPGTLDGGDVLRIGKRFYVGISKRTNEEGVSQFRRITGGHGYTTTTVPLGNMLHLKSGIASLGNNRLIAVPEVAGNGIFAEYEIYQPPPGESYVANCIRIDDGKLIIAAGHPKTREALAGLGYDIVELEMTEFRKMDGGLSCLSILF